MAKIIVYGTEKDRDRLWDYLATAIVLPRPWWKRFLSRWIPAFKEKRITIGPRIELKDVPSASSDSLIFYEIEEDK